MSAVYAFLFSAIVCLIAEIIINNTKLTPGHVTSLFSVIGAVLAFFDVYKLFIEKFKMGAVILISNFGNSLYTSALEGFNKNGVIGIFSNMLKLSSLVVTSTIIFSFTFSCLFRSKD